MPTRPSQTHVHEHCTEAIKRNQLNKSDQPPSRKKAKPTKTLKRTPSKEYDFLLGEDIDRARLKKAKNSCLVRGLKRKALITLGDSSAGASIPSLLGPILSDRFKGLKFVCT